MSRYLFVFLSVFVFLWHTPVASAGMPAPLPTPDKMERVFHLNNTAAERVQVISFLLLVLAGCALAVRWLWNLLRRDLTQMPRLTFGKALVGVLLWGSLFVVVLTMIAGARELMTPGAWEKQGFTYRLAGDPKLEGPTPGLEHRQQLERLRQALWHFAALHQGRFPSSAEISELPADLWELPDGGGLRFLYAPGLSVSGKVRILAWEPDLPGGRRLVLRTNGDIAALPTKEVQSLLEAEAKP